MKSQGVSQAKALSEWCFFRLLRFVVDGVLAAEAAILRKRKFLFHLLFIARSLTRDALTVAALQFGHVVLDLAHKNVINRLRRVRGLLYGKTLLSSTLSTLDKNDRGVRRSATYPT